MESEREIKYLYEFVNSPKRFVYIDLGANTGDSVYTFFGAQSKYPKFSNSTDIEKNQRIVYAVEANPRFNEQLDKILLLEYGQ